MNKEELAKQYAEDKLAKNFLNTYKEYSLETQKTMPIFEAYDLEEAYCDGFDKAAATSNLWKAAQGDDLPEIDREVIALQRIKGGGSRVVFAHRPPASWVGKNIITGEETVRKPKRYGKGKWNMPDVKYWLDVEFPKEKKDLI